MGNSLNPCFTMQGFLLSCLVALATCQSLRYDLSLNPTKTYEYKYEGVVSFGLGIPGLAESGMKIICKARITGTNPQTFLLQISDLALAEYNGFPGKNGYDASPKLTKHIAAQLIKPFAFEYSNGHVGEIHASPEISTTVVNIVRGILSFFQVTVKTTHIIYDLEEIGIHGNCQSSYATEENMETKDMTITQVVDISNCKESTVMYTGMATSVEDKFAKERGESIASSVRYIYTVKPTAEGGLITRAHALEQRHFTPFNVKGGTYKMKATKELVLLGVSDAARAITFGPLESKGNIVYKFGNVDLNTPFMMNKLENPVPKAIELIKSLAEANIYSVDSAATEDSMKLYILMRVIPYEGLETMWKQLAVNPEQRRWFLDATVEIGDAKVLKFFESRFQAGDLDPIEAWQTFLMVIEHLQVTPELVEQAKGFLTMPFSKSDTYLWNTVVLSYGSLVYKHCVYYKLCDVRAVQPLLDMAREALRSGNKEDMILALKALGNAGHPRSIKTIMRFLPGVAATPVDLPLRVQREAVQAMRLIAPKDPHSVQDITLSLFLQKSVPAETRMQAFMILFETKPSMALVSTVTTHLLKEKDLQVASFAYTYLQSFSRSSTPDNHLLSTASSVAVKILAPKYGRLAYHYSKAIRMDWFDDNFLMGTATEIFMLRSGANIIPTEIMSKGKLHIIGRIVQLLELGMYAEGIKELFGTSIPGFKGDFSYSDLMAIVSVLQNWEALPNDKPIFSAHSRVSGQEWFYTDISKELIRNIVMAFSSAAGKASPLWAVMENLQRGTSWHYTRPFLVLEARYFEATTLGLPVEISKYYNSVTGITVNAKASSNPSPTEGLGQLLTSDILLETDGFAGVTKDFYIFYGINTDLFQCGFETRNKNPIGVPWKFAAKINIAEKRFELDIPTPKEEVKLFSMRSDVYAVSRNIEELDQAKRTPILPATFDSNEEVVHMDPTAATPELQKILKPNTWHPASKVCAESNVFGVGVCVDYELKRQFYYEEYPLYYFLGYTSMSLQVVPVQAIKPVDKIHFELNAGSSRHPMSVRQLLETLRRLSKEATERINLFSGSASSARGSSYSQPDILMEGRDSRPEPVFVFKALAMSGNQKPEGYDANLYYTPEENNPNAQLIVSELGVNTNWKMCVDSCVGSHADLKTHVRWGAECQTYEMSMKAAAVPSSNPTLLAKVHWTKIPEYMQEIGTRVESYIPGVAFLLGFYQENERNAEQELSSSVSVSSADSIDVKIKFPEYTIYRKAISFPVPSGSYQHKTNATLE